LISASETSGGGRSRRRRPDLRACEERWIPACRPRRRAGAASGVRLSRTGKRISANELRADFFPGREDFRQESPDVSCRRRKESPAGVEERGGTSEARAWPSSLGGSAGFRNLAGASRYDARKSAEGRFWGPRILVLARTHPLDARMLPERCGDDPSSAAVARCKCSDSSGLKSKRWWASSETSEMWARASHASHEPREKGDRHPRDTRRPHFSKPLDGKVGQVSLARPAAGS